MNIRPRPRLRCQACQGFVRGEFELVVDRYYPGTRRPSSAHYEALGTYPCVKCMEKMWWAGLSGDRRPRRRAKR